MRSDMQGHRVVAVTPAITPRVAHVAAEANDTGGAFVRWLGDVSHADASRVGVMGAALGELTRAGHPVPPGFVVTTAAYLRALDQVGGRGALRARMEDVDVDDLAALTRAARSCHGLVRSSEVPPVVLRSMLDAYERLGRDAGQAVPVAVRASPTPDLSGSAPGAKVTVTFTDVHGGLELVDRVVACWASQWSPAVVADRAARAIRREPAMAVVVHRLSEGTFGPVAGSGSSRS